MEQSARLPAEAIMLKRVPAVLAGMGWFLVVGAGGALGSDWPCQAEDGFRRAGNPQAVACYAVSSDTGHYVGYYVGGGAPCLGDHPWPEDGTWGWDYRGFLVPKKVILGWYHGRRYQEGIGSYRTVGSHLPSLSTP
jgi:hypothetical protein